MWEDGAAGKPIKRIEIGDELDRLSITELDEQIEALQAEIERVQGKVAEKRASASAANSAFKI